MDSKPEAQIGAQRLWARQKPVLDRLSGGELVDAIQNLVSDGDPSTLDVLAEEIPLYLAGRGSDAGWFDDALAQRVPELAKAGDDVSKLLKAVQIAEANQRSLHQSYLRGTPVSPQIPLVQYDPDA